LDLKSLFGQFLKYISVILADADIYCMYITSIAHTICTFIYDVIVRSLISILLSAT